MTEIEATEDLIKFCEERIKETPELNGYYSRIKENLLDQLDKLK
jgi:hypothetical protein